MRREEEGGSNREGMMRRKRAEEKRKEGVTARQRIKKEAALQLERRVQTTLGRENLHRHLWEECVTGNGSPGVYRPP